MRTCRGEPSAGDDGEHRSLAFPGRPRREVVAAEVDALLLHARCLGEASPEDGQGRQAVAVTVENVDRSTDLRDVKRPRLAVGLTIEPPADRPLSRCLYHVLGLSLIHISEPTR